MLQPAKEAEEAALHVVRVDVLDEVAGLLVRSRQAVRAHIWLLASVCAYMNIVAGPAEEPIAVRAALLGARDVVVQAVDVALQIALERC